MMYENPVKRPVGMTILLVLSLINAIIQIFSALGMFVTTPVMSQMMADGSLEEAMEPFLSMMKMSENELESFWLLLQARLSINPIYYLFTALLYVGSLIGVVKMFKLQRTGFHI